MSINQLYLINFIVHFISFLRLPIVFNLDTIELFYDDCCLLVTFENSLDQDQVTVLCVCVCLSVCLPVFMCVYGHLLVFTLAQTSLSLQ